MLTSLLQLQQFGTFLFRTRWVYFLFHCSAPVLAVDHVGASSFEDREDAIYFVDLVGNTLLHSTTVRC